MSVYVNQPGISESWVFPQTNGYGFATQNYSNYSTYSDTSNQFGIWGSPPQQWMPQPFFPQPVNPFPTIPGIGGGLGNPQSAMLMQVMMALIQMILGQKQDVVVEDEVKTDPALLKQQQDYTQLLKDIEFAENTKTINDKLYSGLRGFRKSGGNGRERRTDKALNKVSNDNKNIQKILEEMKTQREELALSIVGAGGTIPKIEKEEVKTDVGGVGVNNSIDINFTLNGERQKWKPFALPPREEAISIGQASSLG